MAGLEDAYRPDGAFIGYIFLGAPPREPRLWFLDRHLMPLAVWGEGYAQHGLGCDELDIPATHAGIWTVTIPQDHAGTVRLRDAHPVVPDELLAACLPGLWLRYQHYGGMHTESNWSGDIDVDEGESWSAVWQLTDTTIPHVHTFGEDDTWRLGVWPD